MMSTTIPIVKVGAIGDPRVSDGRLIPFLTFSADVSTDLERSIETHIASHQPGDVISTWGWRKFDKTCAFLKLELVRPVPTTAHFRFPLKTMGYVVDWIRTVNGLYLQSSRYGNSLSEGWGKSSMLVEISSESTFPKWEEMYQAALIKKFKGEGVSKKQAVIMAKQFRKMQRELWFRRNIKTSS